eukprot:1289022-Prymnesium_polylepis.1
MHTRARTHTPPVPHRRRRPPARPQIAAAVAPNHLSYRPPARRPTRPDLPAAAPVGAAALACATRNHARRRH